MEDFVSSNFPKVLVLTSPQEDSLTLAYNPCHTTAYMLLTLLTLVNSHEAKDGRVLSAVQRYLHHRNRTTLYYMSDCK